MGAITKKLCAKNCIVLVSLCVFQVSAFFVRHSQIQYCSEISEFIFSTWFTYPIQLDRIYLGPSHINPSRWIRRVVYPTPPFTDVITLPLRDLKNCVFLLSNLFWQRIFRFNIFQPVSMNISSEIFKIDMYHHELLSFYFVHKHKNFRLHHNV